MHRRHALAVLSDLQLGLEMSNGLVFPSSPVYFMYIHLIFSFFIFLFLAVFVRRRQDGAQ